MLRGFWTAASGMFNTARRLDVISDNIANVQTVGFKPSSAIQRELGFAQALRSRDEVPEAVLGRLGTGVVVRSIERPFVQGSLSPTGKALDVAITGDAYFSVTDNNGVVSYTRDGRFVRAADGIMRMPTTGLAVLDTSGQPIDLSASMGFADDNAVSRIGIAQDGTVSINGAVVATLALTHFTDRLLRADKNLFRPADGQSGEAVSANATSADTSAPQYQVNQGLLESSATDLATEMVATLSSLRDYQMSQRILSMTDETLTSLGEVTRPAA